MVDWLIILAIMLLELWFWVRFLPCTFFLPRLVAIFWLKECLYTYFRGCRTWISTRIVEILQGGRVMTSSSSESVGPAAYFCV
jgi:hypothetical protein